MQPFIDSTALIDDGVALAEGMRRDGYLFLRGLLPKQPVHDLQQQIGDLAQQAGWLRRDTPVADAMADPAGFCVDPEPAYLETLRRINRLEDYHALKHHPALIGLFERMLGGEILPHPRVLMRNIFPARDEYTTKAHQDFPNVQGTTEVYTAWIPLIDIPMQTGPLQVAVGTHTGEIYDFDIGAGAGGIEITDPFEGRWASGPFAVGDVLIFHSLLVHKGVPNRSLHLRMSMDVRYQRADLPFNPDNAHADGQPLAWDDIYAGWRRAALKYYWRRMR
ncbi:MAG: phytanoyl-CoA dioxygenase family protein, partial [Acetobacteraceae bacterium]